MDIMQRAIDHGAYTDHEHGIIDNRLARVDALLHGRDHLTELACLALTRDDNELRSLAKLLVRWPNRYFANRIAQTALEISHV